jgi:hypothetical protein
MSAEYTYYVNSDVAADVQELLTTESMTVTVVNTGDVTGTDLGFYLKVASNNGPFEYPSTESPATNLIDLIFMGQSGYGLAITQGSTTITFEDGVGDSYETRIPLTIGSGINGDELAAGESVDVVLTLTLDVGMPSVNLYVDLSIL